MARNDSIFNSKISKRKIVASKAKAFLLEAVGNYQIDEIKLEAEHKWLGSLQVDKIRWSRLVIKPFWQVRIYRMVAKKKIVSIFFDGASKGKSGQGV